MTLNSTSSIHMTLYFMNSEFFIFQYYYCKFILNFTSIVSLLLFDVFFIYFMALISLDFNAFYLILFFINFSFFPSWISSQLNAIINLKKYENYWNVFVELSCFKLISLEKASFLLQLLTCLVELNDF